MLESEVSLDDEMPSSLRDMVKSNSQLDFFTEEGNRARGMDSQLEFSSSSAGLKGDEEGFDRSRQSQDDPSAKFQVVGKSEK